MNSKPWFIFLSLLLICGISFCQVTYPVKDPKNITFAFGSCTEIEEDVRGKIFYQILDHEPDLWAWIGDAIYIESNEASDVLDVHNRTKRSPGYDALLKSGTPIIGIWDDHDFGPDNGGKHYPYKERNREFYLHFIDEPFNSLRWHREGLYASYYLGEQQQVKIILLDMRYNKGVRMPFDPREEKLDEAQWVWLEEQLSGNDSVFTLITSGVQVFPDDRLYPETWFTNSKERLLGLIRKTKRSGVILLSGDVHYAEVMEYPCPNRVEYQLTELTSSGLTHYLEDMSDIIDGLYPYTYSTPDDRFYGKNYGIIRFLFDGEEPQALLEIHNKKGQQVLGKTISYSQVRFDEAVVDLEAECAEDVGKISRLLRFLFVQFARGNGVAIALILIVLAVVLALVLCWVALILYRVDKRRGKEFKSKEEKRSYMAMKYKYRSI